MRAVLLVFIIAVFVIVIAMASGFISVSRIRGQAPQIVATANGVSAKGGQAPAFDVETGSVKVGSAPTTMNMPTLEIQKAGEKPSQAKVGNKM